MKADFVRILIPPGLKSNSDIKPGKVVPYSETISDNSGGTQVLPSSKIHLKKVKSNKFSSVNGFLTWTALLLISGFILRHELFLTDLQQEYGNRISALEHEFRELLTAIDTKMLEASSRQKREASYQSSTSYRAQQVRNGRGGSSGGSYFGGDEESFLGRVTLPPIKGYQFNEERYDGGSANDDDVDLDSASVSAEAERLSRQQTHSSSYGGSSGSSGRSGQSSQTHFSTSQQRTQTATGGGRSDSHLQEDYDASSEGGRGGSATISGTGCTTGLCGSGGGSSYSGGGGSTYSRTHQSSSTTHQQSPVVTTYSQTLYPIKVQQGGSRSTSYSSQSAGGSVSGARDSSRSQQSADYSSEGDELVIGGSNRGQTYVPEIARVLQIPNNVFRTGGIDLGLGNSFTHSGNRCGNVTRTTTRTGSLTGTHAGHGHLDSEPCPAAIAGGAGGAQSYNYTYTREVSSSSSRNPGGNITTTVREYGSHPDRRQMQNFTRTEIVREPYHPPMVIHVEPATSTSRYQTRQQSHSSSHSSTQTQSRGQSQASAGRGAVSGVDYGRSGSGSTFYFKGSQNTRQQEVETEQRHVPTETRTHPPQPYERVTETYRIPYVEEEDSYERTPYVAPTYVAPTYPAPRATYAPQTHPPQTYSPQTHAPVYVQQTRTVTYKSSTCRGTQRPLAAHYVGDGAGMLTSADGIFKEWKSSEWMTASLYQGDGHYAASSTNFVLSSTTGSLTVKKAGLYFIYSQIHIKEGDGLNGFMVEVNSSPMLTCSLAKTNSCYTAGLRFLEENDTIIIKAFELTRVSGYSVDKSFFGLMSVGNSCS